MAFYHHLSTAINSDPADTTYQVRFEGGDQQNLTRQTIATMIMKYFAENRLCEITKISFGSKHDMRVFPMESSYVSENYDHPNQQILRLMSDEYKEKSHFPEYDFWVLCHISTGAVIGPILHGDLVKTLLG